jgi:exonuclease SbcC
MGFIAKMRCILGSFSKKIVKVTLLSGMMILTTVMPTSAEVVETRPQLEDKLYRQALYFYFIGNYGEALNQISLNRLRFNSHSSRSRLFEAGLQVNVGLHHLATESLQKLQKNQVVSDQTNAIVNNTGETKSNTSPAELMLIALLQLAEQQIQQGDNKTARETLSQITTVSATYSDQYKILNQLAYWPELPTQSATQSEENSDEVASNRHSSSDAYIELNRALLLIEQGEFELAEPLLTKIKNTLWLAPSTTFWQSLFNPITNDNDLSEKVNDERIQQQGLNDYAQLLLAQMYVKQELYDKAYYELQHFPQDSPYTESALFIFAFSAQKINHHTKSLKLFDLMKERFPHSNLGWQASLLLAAQVVEHKSLEQGMTSYQNSERLYQQRLMELANFHQVFLTTGDLLNFSPKTENLTLSKTETETKTVDAAKSSLSFITHRVYRTDSVWLQKALLDNELQANYQALIELDLITVHLKAQQEKNLELKNTLALNNKRKAKVVELQQQAHYRAIIVELTGKKQKITEIVTEAESQQLGQAFVNKTEEQWLDRIKTSKHIITAIDGNRNTDNYQERVKRIEGVLTWQLQQSFPERLWQHKKLIKEVDQLLTLTEQQRKRFAVLVDTPSLLSGVATRIKKSATDIKGLLNNVVKLRAETSDKIQKKVQQFVNNQRQLLEQHLLTSRHEMAAVLESMAKYDKRVERQLSPSVQNTKTQNTKTQKSNITNTLNPAADLKNKEGL